jgi:NAD(P)-dependent dehydrogenase (short-subunit alcohol dehydrogenase family)
MRAELRRLDHAGMVIGVHTWDHHRVTTYVGPDFSRQLERPKAELETLAGHRLAAEGRDRVIAQEPVGRMGTPEEIAATVLWLCSDAASFVIGHAMVVDGGQTV